MSVVTVVENDGSSESEGGKKICGTSSAGVKGFPVTAYWKLLQADDATVMEPCNVTFSIPRAPTIRAEDDEFVPVKYDFKEKFDVPIFQSVDELVKKKLGRFGKEKVEENVDGQ